MTSPTVAAVLPVKDLTVAKTRLELPPEARSRLAMAFALDTLAAVLGSDLVQGVVVVTSDELAAAQLPALDPARVKVVSDCGSGLGPAVRRGVQTVRAHGPDAPVCIVPTDLPCLRSEDLDTVLRAAHAARPARGAFVPDRSSTGTTLMVLGAGHSTIEHYGPDSAARHAAVGLLPLQHAPLRVRHDVDTVTDLLLALRQGPGPATRDACARLGLGHECRQDAC